MNEKPGQKETESSNFDNLEDYVPTIPLTENSVEHKNSISPPSNIEPPPEHFTDVPAEGHTFTPEQIIEPVPSAINMPTAPSDTAPTPAEPPFDEWARYEKSQYNMSEYLESEWDHKSWMLGTKFFDKEVIKLHELVLKELSLSNLPDSELAFIYSVKMDCIEEWLSMGLTDLAKQRLVHMLFRLRLLTSIDGLELVGQHGTSAISMSMDRPETQRAMIEEEEQQNKKPKLGLGSITNRLKGMTK
jgi:hypothetical protein